MALARLSGLTWKCTLCSGKNEEGQTKCRLCKLPRGFHEDGRRVTASTGRKGSTTSRDVIAPKPKATAPEFPSPSKTFDESFLTAAPSYNPSSRRDEDRGLVAAYKRSSEAKQVEERKAPTSSRTKPASNKTGSLGESLKERLLQLQKVRDELDEVQMPHVPGGRNSPQQRSWRNNGATNSSRPLDNRPETQRLNRKLNQSELDDIGARLDEKEAIGMYDRKHLSPEKSRIEELESEVALLRKEKQESNRVIQLQVKIEKDAREPPPP
jgi:hypothetical protein